MAGPARGDGNSGLWPARDKAGRAAARAGLLCLTLLLGGCLGAGERIASHADWDRETARLYPGETRQRLIAAAETILNHSDPGDITFDYRGNGFSARRRYFLYAAIASVDGEDRWSFGVAEGAEAARARVTLVDSASLQGLGVSDRWRAPHRATGSYRLFFARLDYMLGKRADWVDCASAPKALRLDPERPGIDGLCSLTHQGREAGPPRSLGPPPPQPQTVPASRHAPPGRAAAEAVPARTLDSQGWPAVEPDESF